MTFINSYGDRIRAEAYATLQFQNTYHLAFRDLPEIFRRHVQGTSAMDFGCGAGRSTRFLRRLGFNTIGADISEDMVRQACEIDPEGDYRVVPDGDYRSLNRHTFDLILAAFTFDNIPGVDHRQKILTGLKQLLKSGGRIVLINSTPELYLHEWASFSTKDFPENASARSGDVVRTISTDAGDRRPVDDALWFDEDYRTLFSRAGLTLVQSYRPLGRVDEPYRWINETTIAPWVIYVVG